MGERFRLVQLFVVLLSICCVSRQDQSCSGFSSTGCKLIPNLFKILLNINIFIDTSPVGDILIEYNTSTPLRITCVIKNKRMIKENPSISSKLFFKKDGIVVGSDKVITITSIDTILHAFQHF